MPQMKSLQILPDFLDQAAHDEMDQEVWKLLQRRFRAKDNADVVEQLSSVNADDLLDKQEIFGAVLYAILLPLSYRGSKIQKKYMKLSSCEDVFSGPRADKVLQLMKICAKKGTFESIRNFSLFRRVISTEEIISEMSQPTISAWSRNFYGTAHQTLYSSIERMNSSRVPEQLYSNYISIVQSSGTGKSRTVDEMARLVFTFPFNLRAEGYPGYAYPAADSAIRDFLLEQGSERNYDSIVAAYLVFFQHMFILTAQRLPTVGNSIEDQTVRSRSNAHELAEEWRTHLAKGDTRKIFYSQMVSALRRLPSVMELKQNEGVIKLNSYIQSAVDAGHTLLATIDSLVNDKPADSIRLVMYFDDAHSLTQHSISGIAPSPIHYHALCKAIDQLAALPLFVVMLSSTLQLRGPSPPNMFYPSTRGGNQGDPQSPITEMPFDLLYNNEPLVPPEGVTLMEACELTFICRFGRPLWRALFMSGDRAVRVTMVETALSKLTGYHPNGTYNHAHLAALSTRLLLEFEPARELSRTVEAELVDNNLRIAYSVPKRRGYPRSGYPSEPILAEAAARLLNRSEFSVPANLAPYVRSGLIKKGKKGELVMRLLLLEAFDKATRKKFGNSEDPEHLTFDHPILVIDFLQALFGEKNMKAVLDKDAQNRANWRTFRHAFGNAYVHFTHFGKSEDESVSNQFGAWAAVMRGMAMQCFTDQNVIDCIVPVVFGLDKKITPGRMSAILVQVKNRVPPGNLALDEKSLDDGHGFFRRDSTKTLTDNRPYITIVMQFGAGTAASERALPTAEVHQLNTSFYPVESTVSCSTYKEAEARLATLYDPDEDLLPLEGQQEEETDLPHPRYEIVAGDCNPTTFEAMLDHRGNQQITTNLYAYLLGSSDVYDEHPRQEEENLAALRNLKPGWSVGDDYYDWTGNEFLCEGAPGRRRQVKSNGSEGAIRAPTASATSEDVAMGS
ncbi:uncharacterized protein LAESUDRAFT_753114 [Laetiporus sulphureus 93-53]|uniref:Uncharacterized protein n=1 Tax=Laetiporus sulphureus 93-53 TaxID=1314785 RepID=A0A165BAC4_9APHY|nr:uncharacterized protein LAESUDRAFT_753114 [Laetiporus sulphureus 93-53]KZT00611.1 hypothetical protein LAESUDRAFT_753114 [Laetiporus sulphureus 93-53]